MKAMVPKGPSMNEMLRQAQKMQEDMAQKQAELEERVYDISAGGGVVNIKINGKKEITELKIAPEIVDPDDVETLEDILIAAVNEAVSKVENTSNEEMQKITGALGGLGGGIPGLF
ncbi:MAG: YbaB/EbfC family nucleoid-associated protein [Clostridia bacterium]|nr:YbaB/EbfC family nucleoid-associated protein [Clostridia bacterium]